MKTVFQVKNDGSVKSPKISFFVIPPRIGVRDGGKPKPSYIKWLHLVWTPVFTGVMTFYNAIKKGLPKRDCVI